MSLSDIAVFNPSAAIRVIASSRLSLGSFNSDRACRAALTFASLDTFWAQALPAQAGVKYRTPTMNEYSGSVDTPCGTASNAVGPFYCPADETIYIDVSFFDQLVSQFGGPDGNLAEEYVVAHEFGHHIEQLDGSMNRANRGGTGADSDSVRIELKADCLAGMWADNATTTDRGDGKPYMQPITQSDLQNALGAAASVGDDHIQQSMTGRVNPESFTHGTSAQRENWFTTGYNNGTLQTCDTLSAKKL
jgi:predicted metalloprotease